MNNKSTIIISSLLLAVIPGWIWMVAPQLTKMPKDFSYKANVFSLDNFYDEQAQKFSGEKRFDVRKVRHRRTRRRLDE